MFREFEESNFKTSQEILSLSRENSMKYIFEPISLRTRSSKFLPSSGNYEKINNNFSLLSIKEENKEIRSNFKKPKDKKIKKEPVLKSLANRNLKLNMSTGLIQYIDFLRERAKFKKETKRIKILDDILHHILHRNYNFRSFAGWISMWNDTMYGTKIRKLSENYFSGHFVLTYIWNSKIKDKYKEIYYKKIGCFKMACNNPNAFGPKLYNKIFEF